jgi:hypothetical protein
MPAVTELETAKLHLALSPFIFTHVTFISLHSYTAQYSTVQYSIYDVPAARYVQIGCDKPTAPLMGMGI